MKTGGKKILKKHELIGKSLMNLENSEILIVNNVYVVWTIFTDCTYLGLELTGGVDLKWEILDDEPGSDLAKNWKSTVALNKEKFKIIESLI